MCLLLLSGPPLVVPRNEMKIFFIWVAVEAEFCFFGSPRALALPCLRRRQPMVASREGMRARLDQSLGRPLVRSRTCSPFTYTHSFAQALHVHVASFSSVQFSSFAFCLVLYSCTSSLSPPLHPPLLSTGAATPRTRSHASPWALACSWWPRAI